MLIRRRRALSVIAIAGLWLGAGRPSAQPAVAGRIVSTSPSVTETLFALGLGDRVVGVSTFCRFPDAARRLPRVGTFLRPDAETIARLAPDLVVVHPGPNDIERQLATLGIRTLTVDRGTLASVFSSTQQIAAAAGEPARGQALVADVHSRLDRVRAHVAGRATKRALIIVGRRPGTLTDLVAVGRGSYLSDLVEIAGGVNALSDLTLPEYPRLSMESVIRLAPDLVIDAGDMGDEPAIRQRLGQLTLELWSRQRAVAAVRLGAVHPAMSDAFVVPGPRVGEVAETFAQWMHGVRAR